MWLELGVESVILGPAASASPGSWLESQISGLRPRLTDSETLGVGPGGLFQWALHGGATAQSGGGAPARPPSLSAETEGFSEDLLDEGNSKITGNRVFQFRWKPFMPIYVMPIHSILPTCQALCYVLNADFMEFAVQWGKRNCQDTIAIKPKCRMLSAWQEWKAPGRSSLKAIYSIVV